MAKKKWLIVLLAVLLVAAVAVFAFWDVIAVYVFPKTVLTKALYTAFAQLQQRIDQSPVSVLASQLDADGKYNAQMKLETENDLAGEIRYDLNVSADISSNHLFAQGTASASGTDLDLSVYMDGDFMALSSQDLLKGAYYGIRYESFPEDIRSIPLLKMFVSEQILSEWDTSVSNIQTMMNKSYQLPELPEFSEEDLEKALTAVLLLPSDVARVEMQVRGEYEKCHRISYSAEGEQVQQLLRYLIDTGDGTDASVSATFYLFENQVVMMQLNGKAGGNSVHCALELMCDADDTLTVRAAYSDNGEENAFCVRHTANAGNGYLYETWTSYPDFEGAGEETLISYRWEPVMGELVLTGDKAVTLYLKETESGLQIITENFEKLLSALTGQKPNSGSRPVACTMTMQKGNEITTPDYKNLSDWSLEDLLILLGGVGSLFGLKTG